MESELLASLCTKETEEQWNEIVSRYPVKRSALIQLLHHAQRKVGYVSPEVMEYIADFLDLTPLEVHEVASFYTMFNLKKVGKYHIQVCRNLSCSLLGAMSIVEHIKSKLGINKGETTQDGLFTLDEVECLASCGTAPMMQINDDYYENLTADKVDSILDELKAKG